jgi:type VI secretion system secreted protein Hcp
MAADDSFIILDLKGIKGECQDSDYEEKIQLQSAALGVMNDTTFTQGKGGSGKLSQIHPINFSKYTCKASPNMLGHCVEQKHVDEATLWILKLAGDNKKWAFWEVAMRHVLLRNFNFNAGGQMLPVESGSLHFAKIHFTYRPQANEGDQQGGLEWGWDLQKHCPWAP